MPQVNWDAFARLPGSAERNFELLCRGLIRRHYAKYGDFRALAAQPGVEFHLKLREGCALGEVGRCYGWQCRWYDLPGGRALGTTRRNKIAKALALTEKVLPEVTDWVLWTRRPLPKSDQKWFYSLKTRLRRHLWTTEEVEEHLSGDGEVFRGTYFGELVLTPEMLVNIHAAAVAPIRQRWQPEVHQSVEAERHLRRMLGEPRTWEYARNFARRVAKNAMAASRDLRGLSGAIAETAGEIVTVARQMAVALANSYAAIEHGDLDLLNQEIANRPAPEAKRLGMVLHQLRGRRHKAALSVANAVADIREACAVLDSMLAYPSTGLISVVADAGCGKTELAAQLTAACRERPAGLLIHGRDLQAGRNFDNLARTIVIGTTPVPSMEALIAALDAAGQRARRRLPLVIDGLNEAEDPRNWKPLLASLKERLARYPYVLVVCTLRTAFIDEALPNDVPRLEIPDFQTDTVEAIRKYFDYYRINAADADLPFGLLRNPLTLRLFCEVTNPKRERQVGVEAMPGSLTALFDSYLKQVSERIAQLAPRSRRFYGQDVRAALDEIGWALWEGRARTLDFSALRKRLHDDHVTWHESILRALEQDGILLRIQPPASAASHVGVLFDALAGHLVADAILSRHERASVEKWLADANVIGAFSGPLSERHPLGEDIFRALAGIFPRRFHYQQLWSLVQEPLRSSALLRAADLEGVFLDAATVDELAGISEQPAEVALLNRLWHTRSASAHPLNAEFLDRILRPLSVARRDLLWTEWVRGRRKDVLLDLERLEQRWRSTVQRSPSDRLRAQWIKWTLTSTDRNVRDQATRTLYWFGRGEAASLFELTVTALSINDNCVSERLLAASYGVAMAHQVADSDFERAFRKFCSALLEALAGSTASNPTDDWLVRLYVEGCIALARAYHPGAVPQGSGADRRMAFADGPSIEPIADDDPRAKELDEGLRMDLDSDTLGRLIFDWRVSGAKRSGHDTIIRHLRGSLWTLGWRELELGAVDENLFKYRSSREPAGSYGKKYAWIGFYTCRAVRGNEEFRISNDRPSDLQIDPSFPEPPPEAPIHISEWALSTPADDRQWIRHGKIDVPDPLFYSPHLGRQTGPWICVYGHLDSRAEVSNRGVFGFLTALLVNAKDAKRLADALSTREYPGNYWLPRVQSDYYTFAGEMPWHPQFARTDDTHGVDDLYRESVRVDDGLPIETEILAHEYAWESYHSALNRAGAALIPSRCFSSIFDLRGVPQSFDQKLPDGTTAALSFRAPAGFKGHLLYLREDLVQRYAKGRQLIWFIWGERQLYGKLLYSPPDWLVKLRQNNQNVWRRMVRGEDLSPMLAAKRRKTSGR